jgi:hypothetical protein
MKITFVNHASIILSEGRVSLMTDPWLEGTAFDDGWGLLSQTQMSYADFADITHIWFSHEHPDHFSPPTLKKIAPTHRRNISVLFQQTEDGRLAEYCRSQGFREVIELPARTVLELGPGFDFSCSAWESFDDSWSYVRTPTARVLNLNDCTVNTQADMQKIRDAVGPIDVLFTQFSISAWDGNASELDRRRKGAEAMLERTIEQANFFGAKYVVPFASFIWFCHEENQYMNEAMLPISEVYERLRAGTQAEVIMMYPGDTWTVGASYDSRRAVERYAADQANLATQPRRSAKLVSEAELMAESHRLISTVRAQSDPSKVRLHCARQLKAIRQRRAGEAWSRMNDITAGLSTLLLRCEPARLHVDDLGRAYEFDLLRGLRPVRLDRADCDIALNSGALWYALHNLWGGETLFINGRFQRIHPRDTGPIFSYFTLLAEHSRGNPIVWRTVYEKLRQRITQPKRKNLTGKGEEAGLVERQGSSA